MVSLGVWFVAQWRHRVANEIKHLAATGDFASWFHDKPGFQRGAGQHDAPQIS
jgi:hypothetical protein